MMCPHCGKETEQYAVVHSPVLNLNAGAASFPYTLVLAANAAVPGTAFTPLDTTTNLNMAAGANSVPIQFIQF